MVEGYYQFQERGGRDITNFKRGVVGILPISREGW